MQSVAKLFFLTAAVFSVIGMIWGIQMSATGDHTLSPAHGHLNLIGFVAMAVFGTYYALTPAAAQTRLAMAHFVLTALAVVLITPGIALAISDQTPVLAQAGSFLSLASMILFGYVVLRYGVGAGGAAQES